MKSSGFYNSIVYKKKQSEVTRKNWQGGIYDFLRKNEKRQCINSRCGKWFETKSSSPKKFCSCKCAAAVNNPKRGGISSQAKEKIVTLYQRGSSMQEIADKPEWSLHKVSYWLDKCNIARRSPSEAAYVKWNPSGDPFKLKDKLSKNEILLKGLGLGLYWGEGDKSNNTSVRVSNTDPQLLKTFREFLIKIYNTKKKLGYSLVLFNDCNEKEAVEFWEKQLGIKRNQFGKIVKIPSQGKGTYRKKSESGVLTISITNKKLKEEILKEIRDI